MDVDIENIEREQARELELIKKLEAVLFISGRFLSLKELVSLTEINPILLRKLVDDLGERYKDSALEIVQKGDMWKMDVSQEYADMVNKLATGSTEFTKAEQETLAIIAYKQPIKQSVLVKIRGNKAYDHIKRYVEMGLINKKKSGHTAELTLNERFHEYFHVNTKERESGMDSEKNSENDSLLSSDFGNREEIKENEEEVKETGRKIDNEDIASNDSEVKKENEKIEKEEIKFDGLL